MPNAIPASSAAASHADEVSQAEPLLISAPDAERLLVQSRLAKSRFEAEVLDDLEARIRRTAPFEPGAMPPDVVTMNSRLVLRDLESGRRTIFTLVFPSCANARRGRVSVLTPLGCALLGARTGQTLTCPLWGTVSTVVVEEILHQPEAAGDYYG